MMTFATKKECASLLAQLAEESLQAEKERNGKNLIRVCWCQERILTVESLGGNLLVRVEAVLPICHTPEVERLLPVLHPGD